MKRRDLEHLIRVAAAITEQYEIMVVGSQSILGAVPNAPDFLLQSMEADIYPLHRPDLADLIDGAVGELSPFEERFGYYAQGVGPETAVLPAGWEDRVVKIQNDNTDLKIGYCLEPHDLAASKLAAGREKDWPFVETMLHHKIVDGATIQERIAYLPITSEQKERINRWVATWVQREADESRERVQRIANLPMLENAGGTAYTFWRLADEATKVAGAPNKVNWTDVEQKTIAESIGEHGQPPEDVVNTLCKYSPGAVSSVSETAIRAEVECLSLQLQAQCEQSQASKPKKRPS